MRRELGFTLMEIIGVLAVMAIMAAVLAPSLVRSVDDAYANAEIANLDAIADGLESFMLRQKSLPNGNPLNWGAAVASQTQLPENQIQLNPREFRRGLYFDPRFFNTVDSAFPGYVQTLGLTAIPNSPRAILVSDLRGNAPPAPTTSLNFNRIWDQDPTASVLEDEYTKIRRINFAQAFHRVLLTNEQTQLTAYSVEAGASAAVPAATGVVDGTLNRYLIRGSELRLYSAPFPAGNLETSVLVNNDLSQLYTTDGANWFWTIP